MKNNTTKEPVLRDGWTHDEDYRRYYQSEDDMEVILNLLALSRASSVVDIGCGNGAFALAAAQRHPSCRVWAFDALDSAVAQCKAKAAELPNVHAEIAWAHSIPLADSSVDRALFRSVLHHIAEPQNVYAEIARILRPGARLVLQAPCNYWEGCFGHVLSEMMMLVDSSHRRFYYRPLDIVEGLQKAGFSTQQPECWTYSFPFLEDKHAQLIREHRAEERLRLRPIANGKWSIESYWVRVIAEKEAA